MLRQRIYSSTVWVRQRWRVKEEAFESEDLDIGCCRWSGGLLQWRGQNATVGEIHRVSERCLDLVWHFKNVVFGRNDEGK